MECEGLVAAYALEQDFIPHMARKYNFEVELITYKWPQWLRSQSEKQRMIWGYKILFLDVLFPLDLNKVIFVDADQVWWSSEEARISHETKDCPCRPQRTGGHELEGGSIRIHALLREPQGD